MRSRRFMTGSNLLEPLRKGKVHDPRAGLDSSLARVG
jgi:hypothetical protein